MSNIQGDLLNVLFTMTHLVCHVLPMITISVLLGGFVWAKTRR